MYEERPNGAKSQCGGRPTISSLGLDISTHKRHYLQQSQYTFYTEIKDKITYYCNYESVFIENRQDQDLLTKYIMPASEYLTVLKSLDLMNINTYSLFDTEESLMNTLAFRKLFLKNE